MGPSKSGCRIILVCKKGLALGKRAYIWLRDVGVGVSEGGGA